jgi:NADPH-dependent F420 reductase
MRTIAVLGGTGKEGGGLAVRWAKAGYKVVLGSRAAEKAQAEAEVMNKEVGGSNVSGAANLEAAKQADVVVLAVPYAGQKATAEDVRSALAGKILIDVTVPLKPPKVSVVQLPPEGSAVLALQQHLGADVKVVSAFQNISAEHLRDLHHEMDCDVLVCADDEAAGNVGVELAQAAGMKAWYCGPLANSVVAEGLTSLLIGINRRYKIPGSGIRITGQPKTA